METATKQAIGPNQEEWLTELESGKYRQGNSLLCRDGNYCCLGVACDVAGLPHTEGSGLFNIGDGKTKSGTCRSYGGDTSTAPRSIVERLALHSITGCFKGQRLMGHACLTNANDGGCTFAEIAAFCRKHPEAVFVEPR